MKEKRRKKNQTTTDNNPTTVSYNAPLQIKEDKTTHLEKRRKSSYIHQVMPYAPPE